MPILFVAATGGHLAQLHRLAPRIADPADRLWVTFDSPQSRSLLSAERRLFVPYIAPRDWPGVARESRHAVALLRHHRPGAVVSTGNAIALSYLPVARSLGIPSAYIESAARAMGPSLTGRIIERVPGVQLFTQYRALEDRRWRYAGSVFDDFHATVGASEHKAPHRIFVTLGTIAYGFPRAVAAVLRARPTDSEVICQFGATEVTGLALRGHRMMNGREVLAEMRAADVVVAHAGIGSALDALSVGKTPVLLARSAAYGEHVDDHQAQIAARLDDLGLAVARRPEDLSADDLRLAARRSVEVRTSDAPLDISVDLNRRS